MSPEMGYCSKNAVAVDACGRRIKPSGRAIKRRDIAYPGRGGRRIKRLRRASILFVHRMREKNADDTIQFRQTR
jgi:hypothetical protein